MKLTFGTKRETPEHLQEGCLSSHILHAEHGQRIADTKRNQDEERRIWLRGAYRWLRSMGAYSNTQHIRDCGMSLDYPGLESDMLTDCGQ